MKVVLISNHVFQYRVQVYNALTEWFQNQGHQLRVVACSMDHPGERRFPYQQIPLRSPRLLRAVLSPRPDVVILFLHLKDITGFVLLPLLKVKRIPVIYWNHGVNLLTPESKVKRPFFGFFHRYSDAILLYSDNERRFIHPRNQKKVFVAPNTLNFSSFPDVSQRKEELRVRYGIQSSFVVLMVSRIREVKRLEDLFVASEYLDERVSVVVVGGGASAQQAKFMDENPRFMYLGPLYDPLKISEIFRMADVFCIPGLIGLSLNQAFYWGLPVVTERVIHSPEIAYLKEGVNGYIVPKGDAVALARRINELIACPDKLCLFSNAARKTILEEGSMEAMASGFLSAIDFVAGRPS